MTANVNQGEMRKNLDPVAERVISRRHILIGMRKPPESVRGAAGVSIEVCRMQGQYRWSWGTVWVIGIGSFNWTAAW